MPSKYNFTNITITFGQYSMIAVSAFGLLTNILNIQVSARKEMRKTAMGFYNLIISTLNVAYLILALFQSTYLTSSQYACILIPYFTRIIYQMSSWLNVMVLFDRMILISYKRRSNESFSPVFNVKKVSLIIVALMAIIFIVNVPNLLFHLDTQTFFNPLTNTTIVYTSCTSDLRTILLRDIIASVTRVILPLVLEVIINTILISKLLKFTDYKNNANLETTSLSMMSHEREYRFAQTIIILNVIYGVSNLISVITIVLINVYGYNQTYISTMSDESAIASFAYVCANIFAIFINFDLIFLVNVITNKKFREEADKLLNRRK
jgi:hypothetical protein